MLRHCVAALPKASQDLRLFRPSCPSISAIQIQRTRHQHEPKAAWAPCRRSSSSTSPPKTEEPGTGHPCKFLETPFSQRVFGALNLTTFNASELRSAFDEADRDGSGHWERQEMEEVFKKSFGPRRALQITAQLFGKWDKNQDQRISFNEFRKGILEMAGKRDSRVWSIAGTTLVTGLAVGVVVPAMPQLVQELSLTEAQFGYVVSAFGLAKLLANVPAGVIVDSYGRRPAISVGLAVAGAGMVGLGLSGSLQHLLAARFATGVGASLQIAGSTMAITDISTAVNRARMLAPVMMAFSAGTVFGPALGGCLISALGLQATLHVVGGLFFVNALGTRLFLQETKPASAEGSETLLATLRRTLGQWRPLCSEEHLRTVLVVNSLYWVALAGGNMTLLPLMLAGQFGLSPAEMGAVFALQGTLNVVCAGPCGALCDRIGPQRLLAPGLGLVAASLVALPLAPDMLWASGPLALMALGSTALSAAPVALATTAVSPAMRTQALSLVRTVGDVGWLFGGVSIGALAGLVGSGPAMQSLGAMIAATAGWSAFRALRLGKVVS